MHPLFKIESYFVNKFDEDNSLYNIFEMVVGTNEPAKELVNWELMIFHKFQVDAKDIKCLLEW